MKLSKLFCTALLTTSFFIPAQANSVLRQQKAWFKPTIHQLDRLGIRYRLNETSCKFRGQRSSNTIGTYSAGRNKICVVDWSKIGEEAWYDTFYHEVFHAVQDEIAGSLYDGNMSSLIVKCSQEYPKAKCAAAYKAMWNNARPDTRRWANQYAAKQTTKSDEWMEREAVLMQDQPALINTFLRKIEL